MGRITLIGISAALATILGSGTQASACDPCGYRYYAPPVYGYAAPPPYAYYPPPIHGYYTRSAYGPDYYVGVLPRPGWRYGYYTAPVVRGGYFRRADGYYARPRAYARYYRGYAPFRWRGRRW